MTNYCNLQKTTATKRIQDHPYYSTLKKHITHNKITCMTTRKKINHSYQLKCCHGKLVNQENTLTSRINFISRDPQCPTAAVHYQNTSTQHDQHHWRRVCGYCACMHGEGRDEIQ